MNKRSLVKLKINIRKNIEWIIFIVLFSYLFHFPVSADMGPKPEISITVINYPEGVYYLDLMIENHETDYLYNNYSSAGNQLDKRLIELLKNNCDEEWHLGLIDGTNRPMTGKLTGTVVDDGVLHRFGYIGVPDQFRIVIATQDGEVKCSEIYTKKTFYCSLIYDYESNTIQDQSPIWRIYGLQFLSTCIPTLFIEGILLFLFGLSNRRNWKVFIITNIVTQISLTAIVGKALITNGLILAMLYLIPVELVVTISETVIYYLLFDNHGKRKRIAYGIIANLCSWVFGLFLIIAQEIMNGLV